MRLHELWGFGKKKNPQPAQPVKPQQQDINEIFKVIYNDCHKFLLDSQCKPLLRGTRSIKDDFGVKEVRKDRKPDLTPGDVHTAFNDALMRNGFTAGRTNSVFCTGEPTQASQYGYTFYIFPIGDYDITWSPKVTDFYLFAKINPRLFGKESKYQEMKMASCLKQAEDAKQRFLSGEKAQAMDPGERESYARSVFNYTLTNAKDKYMWDSSLLDGGKLDKFITKYYRKDDMAEAISSKNEIMVACDKYYYTTERIGKQILGMAEDALRRNN